MAGSTYRSTDLTHWLVLDIAAAALADAVAVATASAAPSPYRLGGRHPLNGPRRCAAVSARRTEQPSASLCEAINARHEPASRMTTFMASLDMES